MLGFGAATPGKPFRAQARPPTNATTRLLRPEGAYVMADKARRKEAETGRACVHLELGQPSFETPAHVLDAGVRALTTGDTKYTAAAGTARLRESIAASYAPVEVSASEVVVGPGAKPGLWFALQAVIEQGDAVIFPDPGFPSYGNSIVAFGGVPRPVALNEAGTGFDMAALRAALEPQQDFLMPSRARVILMNSPSNPTGGVTTREELEAVAALAIEHDCIVISDEIYSRLVYDEGSAAPGSILAVPGMRERCVVVDGFSKTFAMTGWRLGWAVMPEELARHVELLLMHSVGCTCSFTQAAGVAALGGPMDHVHEMREEYRRRRDFVVGALNAMDGVSCRRPQGAFYAFPDVSRLSMPSAELADHLLEHHEVAVLPGDDFGAEGRGFLRLSYVSDMPTLERGMERLAKAFSGLS